MRKFESNPPRPSEITPEAVYLSRRALVTGAVAAGFFPAWPAQAEPQGAALKYSRNAAFSTTEPKNSFEDITTYNNYYEFGTSKEAPSENAQDFKTKPWSLTVAGEAQVTGRYNLEDVLRTHALEERIYRLRCVERWSMVIPWVGFPLAALLKRFKPTSKAQYVEFTTLLDPKRMPGQRYAVLDWPYVEGLRMDEAMHPLAFMVVGLYGRVLPNQNGAPLRLVVPWKYGFKGIKGIVRINFRETQPRNSWNVSAPHEYGFYANVNPEVDHPRWSQARERRIGPNLFSDLQPTLLFNGYADQVAALYRGMDLAKNY